MGAQEVCHCQGLFCTQVQNGGGWDGFDLEGDVVQDMTWAECQDFCILDDANNCIAVIYNLEGNTCQRIKSGAAHFPPKNFWAYVPSLGDSIQFQPSELQWWKTNNASVTATECQAFMMKVDLQDFPKNQGHLVAQWTPNHGDATQFVQTYYGRPAISEVTAAYMPPSPPHISKAALRIASGPRYLQVTQAKHSNGDTVVGLTDEQAEATKFEFSNGGITRGSECFTFLKDADREKKIGMHGMQHDGGALHVQEEPKCSGFPNDKVPKGGAAEWNMIVHNRPWCLADPGEDGVLQAIDIDRHPELKDKCSKGWQISSNSLRSALTFNV